MKRIDSEPIRVRGRLAMRAAAVGSVLAVAACGGIAIRAGEIDGLVRLVYERTEEDDDDTTDLLGTFNINWIRPVTNTVSSRLTLRYLTSSQETLFEFEPLQTTTENLIEPRYELSWTTYIYELSLGSRWAARRSNPENSAATEQKDNDLFARFNVHFDNRPEFLLEWDRRSRDSSTGPETINSRLLGTVSYTGDGWNAAGGARRTLVETKGVARREGDELLFDASINQPLAQGRALVFASVSFTDITATDILATQTLVPIPRAVLGGLSALDTVPEDGALQANAALVDGNRGSATAINIGGGLAGGEIGWNLGVELALADPVDVIDVWLADPIPAENAVTYQWEVYTSEDNDTWTRLPGIAFRSYDEDDGRFRLTFLPVTARFVKIVNITVDDALDAVFVTEIEAFGRELREGRSESTTRTGIANAAISWTPAESLSVTLSGYHNRVESETESREAETADTSGSVNVGFRASEKLLGSLSHTVTRRERDLLPTEDNNRSALTLTALPVEDLELTLVSDFRTQSRDGIDREAERISYLLRAATLLYRDLSLSAEYGRAHEESLDTRDRNRESARAVLDMRPRQELQLNSSYSVERLETPSLPADERNQDVINWTNRLIIRPSSVLSLIAQATYFDLPTEDGWSTAFQFDWLPFQGGAIQISLDYRDDIPLNGLGRRIRSATLRWKLNRKMFVDIEAARRVREIEGASSEARSLFTVFFQGRF